MLEKLKRIIRNFIGKLRGESVFYVNGAENLSVVVG